MISCFTIANKTTKFFKLTFMIPQNYYSSSSALAWWEQAHTHMPMLESRPFLGSKFLMGAIADIHF